MDSKSIILVGPKPSDDISQHPGGQLTASIGLVKYAKSKGYEFDIIDTCIVSFPPPSFIRKCRLAFVRVLSLVQKLSNKNINGVIVFVGARHSFFERIVLSVLAKLFQVKTLFCIRDGYFIEWMHSSSVTCWLVCHLLRIPHQIVVQGNFLKRKLTESGIQEERLAVVRNWQPDKLKIANIPKMVEAEMPLRLIFVGWLVKEKGVWELIKAISGLTPRYKLSLDIIGGGTLEAQLRKEVLDLNLDNIRIHGWMSSLEIQHFFEFAHVFVLPTYFEGFPNALLEAMAKGLPAICSDVGAISDSIEHELNGILIPPKDASALMEGIEVYLKNPHLVMAHSMATLKIVKEKHDSEINLKKLFSLLN